MRILKFNEAIDGIISDDISTDRSFEIIDELKNISNDITKNIESVTLLSNELSSYKSNSKDSNDQIDDSAINTELLKSQLEEVNKLIDNICVSLKDYNENGRKFLY